MIVTWVVNLMSVSMYVCEYDQLRSSIFEVLNPIPELVVIKQITAFDLEDRYYCEMGLT